MPSRAPAAPRPTSIVPPRTMLADAGAAPTASTAATAATVARSA